MLLLLFICLYCFSVVSSVEYCVVGAGPSGLQMGYFLERSGHDYMIYERDPSPGWFYKLYPRHRKLISINKRFNGRNNFEFGLRHDWNSLLSDDDSLLMTKYSKEFFPKADVFVKYLSDYATKLKLKIRFGTNIKNVTNSEDGSYTLKDKEDNIYPCKYLIMSTGIWVENIPKNVPGMEHTEGYPKMSVNPDDYDGQTVLILGRGNSGYETATHIMGSTNLIHMLSRGRARFSWETHYVGDLRAVNANPIDTYQLKSLDGQLEGDISTIRLVKQDGKIHLLFQHDESHSKHEENRTRLPDNSAMRTTYDRVLRCLGFKFDRSIFDTDTRPQQHPDYKKYPYITHSYESRKQKNMYFTGTSTHSLDFRKSAGGFIHGFRYTTRALHRLLMWKNHGIKWPSIRMSNLELINHLFKRMNEASGIYQMFYALADVILLHEDNTFEYLEEFPVGLLGKFNEKSGHEFKSGIVMILEYGKNFSGPGSDPFNEKRATGDATQAHLSNFLHPVLYYYRERAPPMTEEQADTLQMPEPDRLHHTVEDIISEWIAADAHILPLRWFIEQCTGQDLRKHYTQTCFELAMTGLTLPPDCQSEYMKGMGLEKPHMMPVHGSSSSRH